MSPSSGLLGLFWDPQHLWAPKMVPAFTSFILVLSWSMCLL